MMKNETYQITGMSCEGCAARVRQAALSVPGVVEVQVDLEKGLSHVQGEDASAAAVIGAVERFGFGAQGPVA